MQALRTAGARARASGNLRGMVPGCTFELRNHPRQAANAEHLIVQTRLLIEDVGRDSQIGGGAAHRTQRWKVEVDLVAHPLSEPLRPVATQARPSTHGPQVALVVGPAGENLWTDDLGRIKVQFPWDRLGQENQHSTCWIRVSGPWAGNQLGGMHLPRIGQEVIVDFLGGNPDLPVCTGRVHNQANLPPWELPGQSALSGFRSRELTTEGGNSAAGRSNHLILDDTAREIQAQLKSDHRSSSLSLGFITRIEDHTGRKDARGEGFELRTDAHGAIRAAEGLLITTEARANATAHVKDMGETVARLKHAQDQHQQLAEAASAAQAQSGDQDQSAVARTLKARHDTVRGKGQTDRADQTDRAEAIFPELSRPHLVLASSAGMAATTAQSLHLQAGKHIALTGQAHISLSVAQRLLVSAKDGLRLFAQKSGMKFIAGDGKVRIEAHKDRIDVAARQAVRITSTAGSILISAKKVVINGGGSFTEWSNAGILHGTSGKWVEHAASHVKKGPVSRPLVKSDFTACAQKVNDASSSGAGSIARD
jgi:type VI secretion system secreted protein VgrG